MSYTQRGSQARTQTANGANGGASSNLVLTAVAGCTEG